MPFKNITVLSVILKNDSNLKQFCGLSAALIPISMFASTFDRSFHLTAPLKMQCFKKQKRFLK